MIQIGIDQIQCDSTALFSLSAPFEDNLVDIFIHQSTLTRKICKGLRALPVDNYPSVSLIICTIARLECLERLLKAVSELVIPANLNWEVVVVDNSGKQAARSLVEDFASAIPIVYAEEQVPGVSRARNRGLAVACGDLLLWLDDDVEPVNRNWLKVYLDAYARHPAASFFAGPSIARFNAEAPDWYYRHHKVFAWLAAEQLAWWLPDQVSDARIPYSLNLGIVRSRFGPFKFREDLGRGIFPGSSGEDTQLLAVALRAGKTGFWLKDAPVFHYVDTNRFDAKSVLCFLIARGRTQFRMREVHPTKIGELARAVYHFGRFIKDIPAAIWRSIFIDWRIGWADPLNTVGILLELVNQLGSNPSRGRFKLIPSIVDS
jgi:glycosyltransferase involved in cell wall biosynthesis